MRYLVLFLLAMAVVPSVKAETYEWVDSAGVTHFTDDPDRVPAKYRSRVRERESVKGEVIRDAPAKQAAPAAGKDAVTEQQRVYGGHPEVWWRGRYATLRGESDRIRKALPTKRDDLAKLHRRWVISMGRMPGGEATGSGSYTTQSALSTPGRHRVAYYDKKAEIERDEARMQELDEQLAALDLEAKKAGVPSEWRR